MSSSASPQVKSSSLGCSWLVAAGGIYSAASIAFRTGELPRQLKQRKSHLLLASIDCKDVAVGSAQDDGIPTSKVLLFDSMGHKRDVKDVETGTNYLDLTPEMNWPRITDREELKKRRACLLYSSDTTGPPKVQHSGVFRTAETERSLDQAASAEIEAHLLAHNKILDAAVIGVPDSDGSGNELPRAYVVADTLKISADEIKQYVKGALACHKSLRGGVVYLEAISKSPSGKILQTELRERAKKENRAAKPKL